MLWKRLNHKQLMLQTPASSHLTVSSQILRILSTPPGCLAAWAIAAVSHPDNVRDSSGISDNGEEFYHPSTSTSHNKCLILESTGSVQSSCLSWKGFDWMLSSCSILTVVGHKRRPYNAVNTGKKNNNLLLFAVSKVWWKFVERCLMMAKGLLSVIVRNYQHAFDFIL